MAQNGLQGPFALSDQVIDQEVSRIQPGAYALEESADLVNFRVVYIGRSDINLNNQLHVHVGSYKRFRYQYCSSAQAAFEKECALYHDFEPRDNPIHPQRPAGTQWKCPRCDLFG
ncbi:MAG TPA: hypothetical protein VK724_17175 [Bryobacteraceae bacterium]|jgi:hypothetical protein|nr:hypothetical protein [Bryobacteraceae bacterium]